MLNSFFRGVERQDILFIIGQPRQFRFKLRRVAVDRSELQWNCSLSCDLGEVETDSSTGIETASLDNLLCFALEVRRQAQMQMGGCFLLHVHIVYQCVVGEQGGCNEEYECIRVLERVLEEK